MKNYDFTIHGMITVPDSMDEDQLKEDLMSSVSMPDGAFQMGVESAELESDNCHRTVRLDNEFFYGEEDDEAEYPDDDDNFNFE